MPLRARMYDTLDTLPASPEIANGALADIKLLSKMDRHQQSLASGFTGVPIWVSAFVPESTTAYFGFLVPPMIQFAHLVLNVNGTGELAATVSGADAVGTKIQVDFEVESDFAALTTNVQTTYSDWGNGRYNDGIPEGRWLRTVAGTAVTWQECLLVLVVPAGVTVYGLSLIWVPEINWSP